MTVDTKHRVVVLGSVPLASRVLRYLLSHARVDVVGVVSDRRSRDFAADPFPDPCVWDYGRAMGVPFKEIAELTEEFEPGSLDFAVSARAPYILRAPFLNLFRKGVVNMHGGPLPELRGVHNANHAILEGLGYSAATIHYMDEGIDTGPVLGRRDFPIGPHDTAQDVFLQTQINLWQLFLEVIEDVVEGRDAATPQEEFVREGREPAYFNVRAVHARREVTPDMSAEALYDRARGLDFPGHEPAFMRVKGQKLYLTTRPFHLRER